MTELYRAKAEKRIKFVELAPKSKQSNEDIKNLLKREGVCGMDFFSFTNRSIAHTILIVRDGICRRIEVESHHYLKT